MSLSFVVHPSDTLKAPIAVSRGTPMASNTGEVSVRLELHADPRETYIPWSLKILTSTSEGTLGADRYVIYGE